MLDRLTIERAKTRAGDGPILIALSGGGDSVALLHLLAEHIGAARLRAVVIDHALRAGSGDDAHRARGFAAELGMVAEVVTLAWPQGARSAQQAARGERYRALCQAARRHGACVIALGHTADDQAETVLMRAAAGSTWRGLAGMAPLARAPVWPDGRGLWLARPLLGRRRAALREALRERGAAWIEDPANANPAYERVRTRARLVDLERDGFDGARLARLAAALRPRVEQLDRDAADVIARTATFEGDQVLLDPAAWAGGGEARRRALSVLIAAVAGRDREPGLAEVERLEARLNRPDFRGAALGGAVLEVGRGVVRMMRDPGALTGRAGGAGPLAPLEVAAGDIAVWDGRLELHAQSTGFRVLAEAAGPVLELDGGRLDLAGAAAVARMRWLVQDHVRHLLDRPP